MSDRKRTPEQEQRDAQEQTATLLVSGSYTVCSNCQQQTLPYVGEMYPRTHHDHVSGYGGGGPGCGARFVAVMPAGPLDSVGDQFRPDLPHGEYVASVAHSRPQAPNPNLSEGRVQELQQDLERVSSNLVHSEHRFDPVMGLDEQGCALCGHPMDYPNHRAFERMGSALEGVRRVAERFLRDGGKVDPQSFLESLDEHLAAEDRSPLGSEILLDWAKTLRSPKEDGEDQLGFTMRLVKAEHVSEAAQVLRRSRL